jgi:hypothetical protein
MMTGGWQHSQNTDSTINESIPIIKRKRIMTRKRPNSAKLFEVIVLSIFRSITTHLLKLKPLMIIFKRRWKRDGFHYFDGNCITIRYYFLTLWGISQLSLDKILWKDIRTKKLFKHILSFRMKYSDNAPVNVYISVRFRILEAIVEF